jgi:hypothetical protein
MHRVGLSCTMAHATSWELQATGEAPSTRGSAVGVGREPVGRRPSGRGDREFRLSLAPGLPADGRPRAGRQADTRPAATAGHRSETAVSEIAGPGRPSRRVSHGALDPAAGGRSDSPGVRGALPSGARLEGADCARLELPKAGASSRRARRRRHRPVEAGGMAPDKKTPLDVAPISSSSMRAGSCSSPTCAGRGHLEGRPPAFATTIVTIAFRSVAGWRYRPSGGAWRCISGVVRGISAASISGRSCTTCSVICVARSTCSGIAARSIDVATSARFWPTIRGSMSTTSRRTHRSSIPPSMCGRRLTMRLLTAPQTISASSANASLAQSVAFVAPSRSCGPAFTPRTCRGPGKSFPLFTQGSIIGSLSGRPRSRRIP